MSKFTFQNEDEDGTVVTIEFDVETWLDAFPKFLDLMRGSGFIVDQFTALYAPKAEKDLFGDRDFLLFDDDLVEFQETPCAPMEEDRPPVEIPQTTPMPKTLEQWASEGGVNHAYGYYDFSRNK